MATERVFVFTAKPKSDHQRPFKYAWRESEIHTVKSQAGSENVYLEINGIEVYGSFEDFVKLLGKRVDVDGK